MATTVPVLDLRRFDRDGPALVADVGRAYRQFGFCGFCNHGIPDEVIDGAYDAFKQFFALPAAVRNAYRSAPGGQRGYTPFGTERAKDNPVPDLKEFFHVGREVTGDNPWPDILRPNRWPDEPPEFRERALALYVELDDLGRRVLGLIARSLGLAADWFDAHVDMGNSILRAIHYPPIEDAATPAVRAAQHEDINLITLLIGSSEAGLEILTRDGDWLPVTTIPGIIVVNIGDMMKRLTNDVLPSTTHRVINPPGSAATQPRYSIPFFLHPNPNFVIRTLPECIGPERPDRYPEPLSADDFLNRRLRQNAMM